MIDETEVKKTEIKNTAEDIPVFGGDLTKCDHRVNSKNTSLLFTKPEFLVYPERTFAVCKECGKAFTYVKDEETGKWHRAKD